MDKINPGKKIFFLHPHSVMEEIARELVRHEYEAYLLYDHKTANELLKLYDNSILFANIDDGMPEAEWEKYIRSIKDDVSLNAKVDIGILTFKRKEEFFQKYLYDIGIKCGYIQIDLMLKQSINIILNILKANEAKGTRQYIRIKCSDNYASLNIKISNPKLINNLEYLKGKIKDISSFGIACSFDDKYQDIFPDKFKFNDIQLNLRGYNCKVYGEIIMKRDNIYIIKFDPLVDISEKNKIYQFIYAELQKGLEKDIAGISKKK